LIANAPPLRTTSRALRPLKCAGSTSAVLSDAQPRRSRLVDLAAGRSTQKQLPNSGYITCRGELTRIGLTGN